MNTANYAGVIVMDLKNNNSLLASHTIVMVKRRFTVGYVNDVVPMFLLISVGSAIEYWEVLAH